MMIALPDFNVYPQNFTEDEHDLIYKIKNYFNKEYTLSIYADIDGYSILVLGRIREENNRNYIIYYSQHKGRLYGQKLLEEITKLREYFTSFLNVYCVNNSVLKILISKFFGSKKYNPIDFKVEEIPNYLLSIELLIGLDKLKIHPLAKGLSVDYQDFNISIKSYSIYALMLPFVEYDEKSLYFWVGVTALEKAMKDDILAHRYNQFYQ